MILTFLVSFICITISLIFVANMFTNGCADTAIRRHVCKRVRTHDVRNKVNSIFIQFNINIYNNGIIETRIQRKIYRTLIYTSRDQPVTPHAK